MRDPQAAVLAGGNEMGALMRALDWSATPVGPVERWPQSLRTALSILLDSSYPMYIAWGPDFVQFYNDGYRPILGSTKHPAALGRSTRETFAEIWPFIGPMFERVMAEGQATFLEDQILPMDRHGFIEECYFTFCYSAIRNESGDVGGVFVTVTETTGRVLGERRLRTLRDLGAISTAQGVDRVLADAAVVLENNPTDVQFSLIYQVEDGACRLVSRTGIDASHPAAVAEGTLDDNSRWPFASVASGTPCVLDFAERFGTVPSRVWPEPVTSAIAIPIPRSGQEGVLEAVAVFGLNPRRPLDEEYRGFTSVVAGQIGSAIAAARAYDEERQRAQVLAELDRAKTTFFSNVSHEFRTPLTLMLGPIEDLLRKPADSFSTEDREKLQLLHRNGLRLLKLVNTLLDFARIEAGRVQASYEPLDLASVTADLASAFRAAVERAGMRLVVECEDLGEPAWVDTSMWEKIVLNLVSNAFKFTFEGEIRVALSRTERGTARLQVTDTGVGIASEELSNLFQRFRRVEGVRSRTHEGSGIGLALVQELARLHGGSVSVASQPGRGSTFTVEIPLGRAHLPADRLRPEAPAASTSIGATPFVEEALRWLPEGGTDAVDERGIELAGSDAREGEGEGAAVPTDGRRWRVLVADDNADMRAYLARLLGAFYDVDLASDGGEALTLARSRQPDLILSDVMMPVMDGFALVRKLRADVATATIPIILLSARAGEESTLEGLATGADDYLVKPFSARELLARVRAHLQYIRAIRQERSRLVSTFEKSPAIIALLSGPNHVFQAANASYRRLVGRDDVVGKSVRELLPEVTDQGFLDLLDGVYRTGVPCEGREARVLLARQPGGEPEECFVDFLYQPLVEPDGAISGIVAHGVDVTAQVRARQELERLYESVKEANEAKRQFLAAMSHELRTPLNAVLGYTDLLAFGVRGALTEPQLADIERIRSASQYLLSLINDILNFTRVEAGQVDMQPTVLPIERILESASELVAPHVQRRGLQFEAAASEPGLTVYADSERLQQILLNLLMNAAKFTPSGGAVRVKAERQNGSVHLHVEDTGRGIPQEHLNRIFEPFVQLGRSSVDESQQGVGLGLAISRDLARRMSGDVLARSEVGKGSTFTVVLPAEPTPVT